MASSTDVAVEIDADTDRRIKALANIVVDKIESRYTLGGELGRGRFSEVLKAVHLKEKVDYAIKVVENGDLTDEENLEALETEIKILRELNHPHIVQLKEVVATADNTYIVMELLSGGELFNRIVEKGSYPEEEAAELFAQILLSVEYLHSKNIVHRDVKPENILYTAEGGRAIKLIDFGYAGMWAADSPLTGLCGTPDYVAPEVLTWYEDDDNGTPYGKGSDLWSLGVLLYVILSGCSPFSADEEEALLAQVSEAKYEFYDSEWKAISAPAKDLISKLLVVDPATRLTMEACLAHPWLAGAIEKGRQKAAEMASAGPSNGPTSAAAKSEVAVEGSPTAEPMSCSNCVLL
jgi:calcium/calmodulin-dependent protein kinase I